jgi:hypothetical protein
MWDEAAKAMAEFSGAVVTAMDADGYPVSVRVAAPRYDAQTGRLPVVWPSDFAVTAGPANVLCHYHDEGLWGIRTLQIKGRLERCSEDWTFVSTDFKPPSRALMTLWRLAKSSRTTGLRYLHTRALKSPAVNWESLRELRRRITVDQR